MGAIPSIWSSTLGASACLLHVPTLPGQEVSNISFKYHVITLLKPKLALLRDSSFFAVIALKLAMFWLALRWPGSLPWLALDGSG